MSYQLSSTGVIRLSDGANIPNDPCNRDWQAYCSWCKQGNVPLVVPAEPSPTLQQRRWLQYPSVQDQLDALYAIRQKKSDDTLITSVDAKITAINLLVPK